MLNQMRMGLRSKELIFDSLILENYLKKVSFHPLCFLKEEECLHFCFNLVLSPTFLLEMNYENYKLFVESKGLESKEGRRKHRIPLRKCTEST